MSDIQRFKFAIAASATALFLAVASVGAQSQTDSVKWGFVDTTGQLVFEPQWDSAAGFVEGLAAVRLGNQNKLINTTGEVIAIAPGTNLLNIVTGKGPTIAILQNGKWGLANRRGQIVIPPKYSHVYDYSEGHWLVIASDGSRLLVDDRGAELVTKYKVMENFREGLARVSVGNRVGFIDRFGKLAFGKQTFVWADDFSDGVANVVLQGVPDGDFYWQGEKAVVDKTGRILLKHNYLALTHYHNGMAAVFVKMSPEEYERACKEYSKIPGSFRRPLDKAKRIGVIDKSGKFAVRLDPSGKVAPVYVEEFEYGLAKAFDGKKYGYVDRVGNYVIKPQFDEAYPFFEGVAPVKLRDKYGLINRTGQFIVTPQFSDIGYLGKFSSGLLAVQQNKDWGFVDKTGRVVITPKFAQVMPFSEGLAAVSVKSPD
jgi:hypothetical protein